MGMGVDIGKIVEDLAHAKASKSDDKTKDIPRKS
jgi:hypothetical protein